MVKDISLDQSGDGALMVLLLDATTDLISTYLKVFDQNLRYYNFNELCLLQHYLNQAIQPIYHKYFYF